VTLLLNNDQVQDLLSPADCLSLLEPAYRELDRGTALTRPRTDSLAEAPGGATYSLKTVDGVQPSAGMAVVRINSDIIASSPGTTRREKQPRANGEYVGLVLAFSTSTGEPLLIMPDGVAQRMRVAATSALALDRMARADAGTLALIGSGWQAGSHLEAALAVRPFETVRCYSPNKQNRETFGAEMTARLHRDITAVATADEAATGADVVLCATNATEPVVESRWIRPGTHIGVVKLAELAAGDLPRFDIAVAHSVLSSPTVAATTGITARGFPPTAVGKALSADAAHQLPELVDLLSGRVAGRTTDQQATCFLNNGGLGLQFAPLAAYLYERATAQGIGRNLPSEWFTETVHP
jgi:alanine dehydrogenase